MRSYLPDNEGDEGIVCYPDIIISESSIIAEDLEHHRIGSCLHMQKVQLTSIIHVSSVWRNIAIGYPILWTNLFIIPKTHSSAIVAWLERSRPLHLNIILDLRRHSKITEPEERHTSPDNDVIQFMDMIQLEVHRCRTLSVATSTNSHMQIVLSKLNTSPAAPMVRELRLSHDEDDRDADILSTYITPGRMFAGIAPSLSKIRLSGIPISSTAMDLMDNLTELSFRSLSGTSMEWMDLIHILALSPALCQLTIWATECEDIPPLIHITTEPPLTMIHLVSLAIGYIELPLATSIISYIHCPNLHNLTLDFDESDCDDIGRGLTTNRPGKATTLATVTELSVTGFSVSPSTAANIVGQLRALHTVDFRGANHLFQGIVDMSIKNFKQHVIQDDHVPIDYICRNLTSVTISGTDVLAVSVFAMMRKCMDLTIPYIRVSRRDFRTCTDFAYIDRFTDYVDKTGIGFNND